MYDFILIKKNKIQPLQKKKCSLKRKLWLYLPTSGGHSWLWPQWLHLWRRRAARRWPLGSPPKPLRVSVACWPKPAGNTMRKASLDRPAEWNTIRCLCGRTIAFLRERGPQVTVGEDEGAGDGAEPFPFPTRLQYSSSWLPTQGSAREPTLPFPKLLPPVLVRR